MFWKLVVVIKSVLNEIKKDNVGAFASQSAFFVIISIIPCLLVFVSMIQYTSVTESQILSGIEATMPGYVAPVMVSIVEEIYNKSIGIVSMAAVAAVWSSAKGIQYLSNGFNAIYNLNETRSWLRLRLRAIGYTLALTATIVFLLVIFVFGTTIQEQLLVHFHVVSDVINGLISFRPLITLAGLIVFFTFLMKALPNHKTSFTNQLPGAVLAAIGWYFLSFFLSIYVKYFNGFSMYGSLTTLMLVMLWLYFGMYILLICAEINSVYGEWIIVSIRSKIEQKRNSH